MTVEDRRLHSRLVKPIDGVWQGQSGAAPCRISDISWGGCFVQTVAAPPINTETLVHLPSQGRDVEITGRVKYVESPMGFAMTFGELSAEQIDALTELLGQPPATISR